MTKSVHQNSMRAHRHNALLGSMRIAELTLQTILRADTTTGETKALAAGLVPQVEQLLELLRRNTIKNDRTTELD